MVAPYWKYPGVLNGRIKPSLTQTRDGSWVFSLGEDISVLPTHRLLEGDTIEVTQTVDLTGVDLLRLRWKMDTGDMPLPRAIVTASAATFKDEDLLGYSALDPGAQKDGCGGVDVISGLFLQQDKERTLRVTGTASNDGDHIISGVPSTMTGISSIAPFGSVSVPVSTAGRLAVFNAVPTNEVAAAATLTVLGLRWKASISIAGSEVFSFVEPANRTGPWRHLAANVSKVTTSVAVLFSMELEQYA